MRIYSASPSALIRSACAFASETVISTDLSASLRICFAWRITLCSVGRSDVAALGDHALIDRRLVFIGKVDPLGFDGKNGEPIVVKILLEVFHDRCRQLAVASGDDCLLLHGADDGFEAVVDHGVDAAFSVGNASGKRLDEFERVRDLPEDKGLSATIDFLSDVMTSLAARS